MLTELNGKAGALCLPAKDGELRCPLIVRPTSEDVVTGHLFGTLQAINPRWWLPDLLNHGLGEQRFRRQAFRKLRIDLWQKQPVFPKHLIPWQEGQTEVDVVITWENPTTTVFVEMKFGSGLSAGTVHNNGSNGFPADQLVRNARIGLYQCRWYEENRLFEQPSRDFVLILLAPQSGNSLVQKYRDPDCLRQAIPHGDRLKQLPRSPFVGELSYRSVTEILAANRRWLTKAERTLADQLQDYLRFKAKQLKSNG